MLNRFLFPAVAIAFLNADKGGDFGFGTGTQKEQLTEAQRQLKALTEERDGLKTRAGDLETRQTSLSNTNASLVKERDDLKAKLDAEEKAHTATKATLAGVEKERDDLQALDKTAAGKAKEQLARNGVAPAAKDSPVSLDPSSGDPIALWEAYEAAGPAEKNRLRAKHGEKLDAAAAAYDAAQAKK